MTGLKQRSDQSGWHLIISGASHPRDIGPPPPPGCQDIYSEYSILLTDRTIEAHIYTYERRDSRELPSRSIIGI